MENAKESKRRARRLESFAQETELEVENLTTQLQHCKQDDYKKSLELEVVYSKFGKYGTLPQIPVKSSTSSLRCLTTSIRLY